MDMFSTTCARCLDPHFVFLLVLRVVVVETHNRSKQQAASLSNLQPPRHLVSASDGFHRRDGQDSQARAEWRAQAVTVPHYSQAPKQRRMACNKLVCVCVVLNLLSCSLFPPTHQQRRESVATTSHLLRSPPTPEEHPRRRRTANSANLCRLYADGLLLVGLQQGWVRAGWLVQEHASFWALDQIVREKFCGLSAHSPTPSAPAELWKRAPAGEAA